MRAGAGQKMRGVRSQREGLEHRGPGVRVQEPEHRVASGSGTQTAAPHAARAGGGWTARPRPALCPLDDGEALRRWGERRT